MALFFLLLPFFALVLIFQLISSLHGAAHSTTQTSVHKPEKREFQSFDLLKERAENETLNANTDGMERWIRFRWDFSMKLAKSLSHSLPVQFHFRLFKLNFQRRWRRFPLRHRVKSRWMNAHFENYFRLLTWIDGRISALHTCNLDFKFNAPIETLNRSGTINFDLIRLTCNLFCLLKHSH